MSRTIKALTILLTGTVALIPVIVTGGEPPATITHIDQVWYMILSLRNYFWAFMGVAVVVAFGIAAFHYLTSGGDPDKVKKARDMVKYALIGVAIILLTGGIVTLVENVLKLGQ